MDEIFEYCILKFEFEFFHNYTKSFLDKFKNKVTETIRLNLKYS